MVFLAKGNSLSIVGEVPYASLILPGNQGLRIIAMSNLHATSGAQKPGSAALPNAAIEGDQ